MGLTVTAVESRARKIPLLASAYEAAYARSLEDPRAFWGEAAEDIVWFERWHQVLDDTDSIFCRWFPGGTLNTCYNAVDRHVEAGRGNQVALIHDSPVSNSVRQLTYRELRDQVARFAGVLRNLGVGVGDRVVIHMPMVLEGAIAMLACARIGAVHSVVFCGTPPEALAIQIDQVRPKVIVTASCGYEYTDVVDYMPAFMAAIGMLRHKPQKCVILQRPPKPASIDPKIAVDWDDAMASAASVDCVPVPATAPLYILYTSGTTSSQPKGLVRDNGGHAVALKWNMHNIYDVRAGDVYWAVSELAWVVGHTNIVYGPLLQGCTSIMFEGKPVGTPDAGAFWRVASQHSVNVFMTTPTRLRMIRSQDPQGQLIDRYDLSRLKYVFVAGERVDAATWRWTQERLRRPVVDHWWQGESGWAIASNCMGLGPLPVKQGSPTKPAPGWDVRVLDDRGKEVKPGTTGNLVCKLPLAPGALQTLWENDSRFKTEYMDRFPGFYSTSDAGFIDEDGYVFVMGRTDDIIMVRGHRFSTGVLEEAVSSHPDVAECAVIGAGDPICGEIPIGLLVLKATVTRPHDEITREVVQLVEAKVGALAELTLVVVVPRLPKTRSGKILRGPMHKIADGVVFKVPATIEDPEALDIVRRALSQIGYAKS